MLPRILVHEAFNKKKDRRDSVDGTDTQKKTMENWVNPVKMQQVRDSCLTAHGEIRRYLGNLSAMLITRNTYKAVSKACESD